MNFTKKSTILLLTALSAVTMGLCAANASAAETVASGTCGENAVWSFADDGTLVISGTGDMADYISPSEQPWSAYSTNLGHVVIEEGITSIGDYAFYHTSVETVSIADSVTDLGRYSFYFCRQLTEMTISENVLTLGSDFLGRCASLTKITVEEGNPNYTADEHGVLFNKGMTILMQYPVGSTATEYSIPETVLEINNYSFSDASFIEIIRFPADLYYYGRMAFMCCPSLTAFEVAENSPYFTAGSDGILFSKDGKTLCKYPAAKKEREYTIPDTVITLGAYAFHESPLESVTIPEGVQRVEWMAFAACENLTEITIPKTVFSIEHSTFNGCSSLSSAKILNPYTEIENGAFSALHPSFILHGYTGSTAEEHAANNQLTFHSLGEIPEELADVLVSGQCGENATWTLYTDGELVIRGEGAMTDWDRWVDPSPWDSNVDFIKKITVEEGITHIGASAFFPCTKAESITLPSTLTSIGAMAFRSCESVTELIIPDSVTTIGNWAFGYCYGLTELIIPDSVTELGATAFRDCISLTNIVLPKGITAIGNSMFSFCSALTTVTLPEGITSIGNYAFSFCENLTEIVIPKNVTAIGQGAFGGCVSLTKVTVLSRNTVFNGDLFNSAQGSMNGATLYGYAGSTTEAYAEAYGLPFVPLAVDFVVGDIDGDGTVDISDVILLFRYSMMPDLYTITYAGDPDFIKDGAVNINDAILLFRHSMMPDLYPIA